MSHKPKARFYTVAQVANLLVVSTRSVRRWIAQGDLATNRFGRQVRISDSDLSFPKIISERIDDAVRLRLEWRQ